MEQPQESRVKTLIFKLVSCMMLIFFMSGLTVMMAYSKHGAPTYPYNMYTVNIWSEIAKLVFSLTAFLVQKYYLKQTDTPLLLTVKKSFNFSVPAILYAIKNNATFYVFLYTTPAVLEVVGQLKVPFTAIGMWLILMRQFQSMQWFAIVIVAMGASISVFSCDDPFDIENIMGVIIIVFIAFLSAFAGVWTEWKLKEDKDDSINAQNSHQYFWGAVVSFIIFLCFGLKDAKENGFFDGYSIDIFWIVIITACQGILTGLVMKYIDNIARIFCHTLSIAIVILLSVKLLNSQHEISPTFLFGTGVVIAGVIQYNWEGLHAALKKNFACCAERVPYDRLPTELPSTTHTSPPTSTESNSRQYTLLTVVASGKEGEQQ